MKELTEQLVEGTDLDFAAAKSAALQLADPSVSEEEKANFLVALKEKGETGDELGFFARVFIDLAVPVGIELNGKPGIDVCGTGGDRLELINVSTTAMFILAAAGAVVLKHGNRAITSRSGGADVLEQLGIPIDTERERMRDCIRSTGVGFLFAPLYHPAFKIIGPVRKRLAEQGVATIFNLLGPLVNPARPEFQVIGVFSPTVLEKYSVALSRIGRKRAWVVHGEVPNGSGMDEVSPMGETVVHEVKAETTNQFHLFAEEFGFAPPTLLELRGGDSIGNAQTLTDVLSGKEKGPKRNFVLINAAAGLVVSGIAPRMEQGVRLAAEIVDSGRALEKLKDFQRFFA